MNDRLHKGPLLSLALIMSLSALAYVILTPTPLPVEIARVTQGEFVREIRADGYFRPKQTLLLSAFADGDIIVPTQLHSGETVKKNQVLSVLYWDQRYLIRSPIDGTVLKVYRNHIGPIRRGEPLIELMNPKNLELVAELLTPDAVRVPIGSPVAVFGWGGEGQASAHVVRVSKAGFIKPSALGVEEERTEVVAELDPLDSKRLDEVGQNFHVELRIRLDRKPEVLKVPIGALISQDQGWLVWTIKNNKAYPVHVTIGQRNNEEAILVGGLQAGDPLINYPPLSELKPGRSIKPGSAQN